MKKDLKLNCDCLGKGDLCGYLKVFDYKDKDCEIYISNKDGIYLGETKIRKLIKYLEKIL